MDAFLDGAGNISSALLGMVNRIGGQIYALLFLSEEPLSLDDIAERLAVSKSNVSINIRLLEDMRMVRKVWVKGSRRDYYEAERVYPRKVLNDFFDKIRGAIKEAIRTIERSRTLTKEARLELDAEGKKSADFMLEKLNLIGSFYYAADKFIGGFFEGKDVDLNVLRGVLANPEELGEK
jgi:DNA-binding transcriptional regulator GbsR (MarR family)